MSLEDEYLREQIERFRNQIFGIIWFTSDELQHMQKWIWKNGVTTIKIPSWNHFWNCIENILPHPNQVNLLSTWMNTINYCFHLRGGRSVVPQPFSEGNVPVSWQLLAENRGDNTGVTAGLPPHAQIMLNKITKSYLKEISQYHC